MSPQARSSEANGIWMCQTCSKLIDSDIERYTVEVLRQWKKSALDRALEGIAGGEAPGMIRPDGTPDEADRFFLEGLRLPAEDAVEAVQDRLRQGAAQDIAAFRASRRLPPHTVELRLLLAGSKNHRPMSLESLGSLTTVSGVVSLVSSGGTGKSTTLIQLAERMCAVDGPVPVYVPLGEWSGQNHLFDFVTERNAFCMFRRQHLMQLAYWGKLTLLLDGWNELSPRSRLHAINSLEGLSRDYPQLGIVISSRRKESVMSGPVVQVMPLTTAQQAEIATAALGDNGMKLLARATHARAIRDLTNVPLYLNALLATETGSALPATKEALLSLLVQQHTSSPAQIERVQAATHGFVDEILRSLADHATQFGKIVIPARDANTVVSNTLRSLAETGQLAAGLAPIPVIDALVAAHLLIRSTGDQAPISFQHQLFQEWFASAQVESLIKESATGSDQARQELREKVLDNPMWEESILFACERLSRDLDGVRAVPSVVIETLGIDPILAALMINRSAPQVWEQVQHKVREFIAAWHIPGTFDRAARFMVVSGRPEFADEVWAIICNDDLHHTEIFDAGSLVDLNVLGPDREARILALPVPQRTALLTCIIQYGNYEDIELATTVAMNEPDPNLIMEVLAILDFREGDSQIKSIMEIAADHIWSTLAERDPQFRFVDTTLGQRFEQERRKIWQTNPSWLQFQACRNSITEAEVETRIAPALEHLELSSGRSEDAIADLYKRFPRAVSDALVKRVANGGWIRFDVRRYLSADACLDSEAIVETALDPETPPKRLANIAATMGSRAIGNLLKQAFEVEAQLKALERPNAELQRLQQQLQLVFEFTRPEMTLPALVEASGIVNPEKIKVLAHLLIQLKPVTQGDDFPADHAGAMLHVMTEWIETLLGSAEFDRDLASLIPRAAIRLKDPSLADPLMRLFERDLEEYERILEIKQTGQRVPPGKSVVTFNRSYAKAFSAMAGESAIHHLLSALGDLRWGREAAIGLAEIWSAQNDPQSQRALPISREGFSDYMLKRAGRAAEAMPTTAFAEAIFAAACDMATGQRTTDEWHHALAIAAIALRLPHGNKRDEVNRLLALPVQILSKHRLVVMWIRAGEIVPADLIANGAFELLERAKSEPWRLDHGGSELVDWLELFPFSDNPSLVHEVIEAVPERIRAPRNMIRLLQAAQYGPPETGLQLLEQLAANDRAYFGELGWVDAVLKIGTEQATHAVLDHIYTEQLSLDNPYRVSKWLSDLAQKYPSVRTSLLSRYKQSNPPKLQRLLGLILSEISDQEIFWATFEQVVEANGLGQYGLEQMLGGLTMGNRPSAQIEGAVEVFGTPVAELRKELFGKLTMDSKQAAVASNCLHWIDDIRDRYGNVVEEPRHPDIKSGRPWPTQVIKLPH
ncbi:NACHT domain-containing protein [Pseudomonas lurida]|uniref:NACHT domain-containing protein n=1 Tax=Pseudomonas lurida TaxID=244566 RepID=UPI003D2769DE